MAVRVFLILVIWAVEHSSTAQNLVADLSSDEVAITTGFTGTELLLFGASGSKGDIVVTVLGPRRSEIVRRKQRVAGIWVNGAEVTFENAPKVLNAEVLRGNPCTKFLTNLFSLKLYKGSKFL